jgi:hypothetical protein
MNNLERTHFEPERTRDHETKFDLTHKTRRTNLISTLYSSESERGEGVNFYHEQITSSSSKEMSALILKIIVHRTKQNKKNVYAFYLIKFFRSYINRIPCRFQSLCAYIT